MTVALRGDVDAIRAFLATSLGDAIHLAAIRPDGPPPVGRWFGDDLDAAVAWAAERNAAGENVHWTVNRVRPGLNAKPGKTDVVEARFAHVDVDPPRDGGDWNAAQVLSDMAQLADPPSFVIDSGGGLQAFWRLEEASINIEAVEAVNRGLRDRFGADACWNIDRLMRVPGTINWPDAKKRARGRVPALASVVEPDDGAFHHPDRLGASFPTVKTVLRERSAANSPATRAQLLTADDLGMAERDPVRATIEHPPGQDRSDDAFACAGAMVRAGYSDAQIEGVLLNPVNAVSAHCLDQANPVRAAWRCIERHRLDERRRMADTAEGAAIAAAMGIGSSTRVARGSDLPLQWFGDIAPQLSGLWLIKKLLPATGLALIYGHPGSGKSFLALDLAFHVALGWDWQGRRVRHGLVVYVGAEGLSGLRNRIVAFRRHHQLDGSTPVPMALVPTAIDLQAPNADTPRLIAAIQSAADASGFDPALIVIDTLSKTFGGGKENTDDMAIYVANCAAVAEAFGCCVMPVHHRPKDAESTEPRGHGSLKGGMDTVILVENGRTKKATVTKQKDGPEGETVTFALRPIVLGQDEDGDEVTSCIIEPVDLANEMAADPLAAIIARLPVGAKLVLRQLDEATSGSGVEPPDSIPATEINRLFTRRVMLTGTWRERAIQAAGTDRDVDRDSGKKAFNRALKLLRSRGIVRVWGDFAWRDWGGFEAERDMPGHLAGQEGGKGGTPGQPGHRSLDLSQCPGSSGAETEDRPGQTAGGAAGRQEGE